LGLAALCGPGDQGDRRLSIQGGTPMSTTITHNIDQYRVKLCSRDSNWISSYKYMAIITLYSGGNQVAYLRFRPSVGNYSDSFYVNRSGMEILNLYFEDRDFDRVLALLQQETPLYVNLRKSHQGNEGLGSITTTDEPVGEEES
jgi:hypothetical protein